MRKVLKKMGGVIKKEDISLSTDQLPSITDIFKLQKINKK
jgi:hypothetical protein